MSERTAQRGWRGALRAASLLVALARLAAATTITVPGQFVYRNGGNYGGITVVDGGGNTYYDIIPRSVFGSDPTDEYSTDLVEEFSQSRNTGRIAFSTSHFSYIENDYASTNLGVTRIFVMNGDGTGVRQVTFHNPNAAQHNPDETPAISPDGSQIAYIGGETIAPPGSISSNGVDCSGQETQALWIVNSDGTNPHAVRSVDWGAVSYCNAGAVLEAAWSPDGARLLVRDSFGACPGSHEVGIINADGSNYQQLSCIGSASGGPSLGLDWSPDGTKIVTLLGGDGPWGYQVWDVSSGSPVATTSFPDTFPDGAANGNFEVRFSPDSTMLAIAETNNGGSIRIVDLSGNPISTISTLGKETVQGDADALAWSSASPGTLGNMTLGVPSVYVNSCPNYIVQLLPSTYNTSGAFLTHGINSATINIASGNGDAFLDAFGGIQYSAGSGSATGTVQVTNYTAASNIVPLAVDPNCNCQTAGGLGLSVRRSGMRYVTSSQDQFVQTLTVVNDTGSSVVGPVNIVISNLSAPVTLTSASGTSGCASSGSPYVTVLQSGSLAAGASASVQLTFRDPLQTGFTYATTVTTGFGAP